MSTHPEGADYLAVELLSELKASNARQSGVIKALILSLVGAVVAILVVVAGFLLYLNQYDFTSTETITTNASGVYTLVDSEGNVIASDVPAEEIYDVMEGIAYGNDEVYENGD